MNDLNNKLINDILEDEEIKKFLKENNLKKDVILEFYPAFSLKKETDDVCAKCMKNGQCLNQSRFCNCILKLEKGRVSCKYINCEYENKGLLKTYFFDQKNEDLYINVERGTIYKKLAEFKKNILNGTPSKGIYIHGKYGTGKSFILYSFAKELVKCGKKVIYAYYPDMIREIKSFLGTEKFEKYILELKKVDILMLDDLGAENNTAFVRDEVLGPILQYRMNHDLPLFATSNTNFELLRSHFAETNSENDLTKAGRIIERLRYLMEPIELIDKDYRNS